MLSGNATSYQVALALYPAITLNENRDVVGRSAIKMMCKVSRHPVPQGSRLPLTK